MTKKMKRNMKKIRQLCAVVLLGICLPAQAQNSFHPSNEEQPQAMQAAAVRMTSPVDEDISMLQ